MRGFPARKPFNGLLSPHLSLVLTRLLTLRNRFRHTSLIAALSAVCVSLNKRYYPRDLVFLHPQAHICSHTPMESLETLLRACLDIDNTVRRKMVWLTRSQAAAIAPSPRANIALRRYTHSPPRHPPHPPPRRSANAPRNRSASAPPCPTSYQSCCPCCSCTQTRSSGSWRQCCCANASHGTGTASHQR